MSENYINKIKIGNTEYDIQASSIGQISELDIVNNTAGGSSDINFTSKNATEGTKTGVIGLNAKGNLSVESLSKHVNLEAAKGIQLKPTTNIIIDTTRRIKNGSNDNEANIEVVYDDYEKDGRPVDQDPYGYLKIHARAIDLRCYGHGGIAIQPCGHDGNNHENKIKFESDRKVSANATVNPSTDYNGEGGKGVEFGTFNNEHTSIFTKDYRFNEEGKVYSVTRGAVTTNAKGKSDYPTQGDDFKDILRTNKDNNCTYSSGQWVAGSNEEYIMGATWKSIVKTANALNDRNWTDCNVSKKGNLQITVADEVEWIAAVDNGHAIDYSDESVSDNEGKQEPKRKYVGDGNVYKLFGGGFYTCKLKNNGDHHLNLEADSTIKLESGFNDIELSAGDKIQSTASVIQFEATDEVDFSTTPVISLMARKINKSGGYESSNAKLKITSVNNFGRDVYENQSNQTIRIPYTELYTNSDATTEYVPVIINNTKVEVFGSDHSHKPTGSYILQSGNLNLLVEIDSSGKLGKKAKVCNNSLEPTLYTDTAASEEFILDENRDYDIAEELIPFEEPEPNTPGGSEEPGNNSSVVEPSEEPKPGDEEPSDFPSNAPRLYTNVDTPAPDGYYIVKNSSNKKYIIAVENGVLVKLAVDNNGTDGEHTDLLVMGWCIELSKRLATDYTGIVFGGNDEEGSGEVTIHNGNPLNVGNMECNISDIVTLANNIEDITTLLNYFKTGEGQPDGPWKS